MVLRYGLIIALLLLQSSPHLSQLLMRLDFNGYYSESGGTLGTS